jgi:uroporphyrinogen-III synthase
MATAGFNGIRVLSLESRRSEEAGRLIRTYGGEPIAAPAMREIPLNSDGPVIEFAQALEAGAFDLVVFTTGVGVHSLIKTVSEHMDRETFLSALRSLKIAARGPKSSSALRALGIPVTVAAAEPFTWRSLMRAMEATFGGALAGMRIAIQEYGAANPEFLAALAEKGASITRVPVYQWALPENVEPLREAIKALSQGRVDVALFMNAAQVAHLFVMADRMESTDALRDGLRSTVIASIGPSTTEGLSLYGLAPDFEPSQSKMGFLIKEAAENAARLLKQKRSSPGENCTQ